MGLETIDLIQTDQIEDLQDDVEELKDKINLAVTDINALKEKINDAIADSKELYEKLMGSDSADEYVPSAGASQDGVLRRLDQLYTAYWDHIHMPPFADASQSWRSSHPPLVPVGSSSPTHTIPIPDSLGALPEFTAVDETFNATAVAAEVTGSYTPVTTKVAIVMKTSDAKRATKLVRKIQGQITAEDRANTYIKKATKADRKID